MKQVTALGLIFLCCAVVTAQETDKGLDIEKLYGDWEYVSGTRSGEEVAPERLVGTVTITKETFKIPGGPEGDFVMAYELDTSKSPAEINFDIKSGPVPEGTAKGLLKYDGEKLWLCYEPTGGDRPAKMESTAENGAHMFAMKRKKG